MLGRVVSVKFKPFARLKFVLPLVSAYLFVLSLFPLVYDELVLVVALLFSSYLIKMLMLRCGVLEVNIRR